MPSSEKHDHIIHFDKLNKAIDAINTNTINSVFFDKGNVYAHNRYAFFILKEIRQRF